MIRKTLLALAFIASFVMVSAAAHAESRTLNFVRLYDGATASITYWQDGRYSPQGLAEFSYFLRDVKASGSPEKAVDPKLADFLFAIQTAASEMAGKPARIELIAGYRELNRNLTIGSKKTSQHVKGRAADFHISGVDMRKLCWAAWHIANQQGYGGVGFYPNGVHGFKPQMIHADVARLRTWPVGGCAAH